MDRRTFAALLPVLMASAASQAQQTGTMDNPAPGQPTAGPSSGNKPKGNAVLPDLQSGVYTPGAGYGSLPKRVSHRYLLGMLRAGNIQLEMHETTQEVGALHEPTDKHLHNEIWCVRSGTCELAVNGIVRRMNEGDVGLVCAGDEHWVRNAGNVPCTYFVITIGPPERYS